MATALVTGAAGVMGARLCAGLRRGRLRSAGARVARRSSPCATGRALGCEVREGNITDADVACAVCAQVSTSFTIWPP